MSGRRDRGGADFFQRGVSASSLFFEQDYRGGGVHDSTVKFSDGAVFAEDGQ